MSGFRFLHAADLHLDSPLRGLEADAPAERIRGATRRALENLVNLALEKQVAFVLLAGDLYDGNWSDWRTGQFLVQQLAQLKRADIPVLAISGNHDAEQVVTKTLPFPGRLFPADRPGTERIEPLRVAVHGQSFATRAVHDRLALGYPKPVEGWLNIGLLHTACDSKAHEPYAPCTPDELAAKGYDYWALGHVHERRVVRQKPWIVFPGNLQGRHIKEPGGKGASLVTVADSTIINVEHHDLDVLRWQHLSIDVTGAADEEAVFNRVRVLIGAAVTEAQNRFLAMRLTLIGPCAAHRSLAHDLAAIRKRMGAAILEIADPDTVWLEDVRVHTRPALDLAALRGQPGSIGTLIAAIEAAPPQDEALQRRIADMIAKHGAALDPGHPAHAVADGQLPEELVDRARALALAMLRL